MTRIFLFLLLMCPGIPTPVWANMSEMVLAGSGEIRYLGLIKVYEASLYLPADLDGNQLVLDDATSRCLQLDYEVALKVEHFVEGAETVMARQHSPAAIEALRPEIDRLHLAYRDVKPGDRYFLCYNAGNGVTTLSLNDVQLVTVESPQFAEMYFGIWLGKKDPIDTQLRDRLLSGQQ